MGAWLPPDSIKVGPAVYRVSQRKIDSDRLGQTVIRKSRIDLAPKQSDSSSRDTLLHEVMHAIASEGGITHTLGVDDADEEKLIRFFTPWLLGVIRDNPELVDYLVAE